MNRESDNSTGSMWASFLSITDLWQPVRTTTPVSTDVGQEKSPSSSLFDAENNDDGFVSRKKSKKSRSPIRHSIPSTSRDCDSDKEKVSVFRQGQNWSVVGRKGVELYSAEEEEEDEEEDNVSISLRSRKGGRRTADYQSIECPSRAVECWHVDGDEDESEQPTDWRNLYDLNKFGRARFVMVDDLSEGQELFPVRVYNDVNGTKRPPVFTYIVGLEDDDKTYTRNPCICQCRDKCNDIRCYCMSEPYDPSVTEWPYDEKTGLLTKPRAFLTSGTCIWECSAGCQCGPDCPSRCVQLGLRYPFEVYMTTEKGWGVRPLRDLPAGAFVSEYAGVVKEDFSNGDFTPGTWYTFWLVSEPDNNDPGRNFFIDASEKGNIARFINHGCSPNVCPIYVYYDDNNPSRGMHIAFFTLRKVKARQELTLNYSADFWKAKNDRGEFCKCGSVNCQYNEAAAAKGRTRGKGGA